MIITTSNHKGTPVEIERLAFSGPDFDHLQRRKILQLELSSVIRKTVRLNLDGLQLLAVQYVKRLRRIFALAVLFLSEGVLADFQSLQASQTIDVEGFH